jgi:hypothetical protein
VQKIIFKKKYFCFKIYKNMFKILILVSVTVCIYGQVPTTPALEYIGSLKVAVGKAIVVGETPHGVRRIVPITGGKAEGPKLNGDIMSTGADWQTVNADYTRTELEALYQIKTTDSVILFIRNKGIRISSPEIGLKLAQGQPVNPNQYYFRAAPVFEAPVQSKYSWMNDAIFICKGSRMPDHVLVEIWKVL